MYIRSRVENMDLMKKVEKAMERLASRSTTGEEVERISVTHHELLTIRRMLILEEASSSLLLDSLREQSKHMGHLRENKGKPAKQNPWEDKRLVFDEDEIRVQTSPSITKEKAKSLKKMGFSS